MGNVNNVDNAKHKRFYVYRHQLDSDVIEYLCDLHGRWTIDFADARLVTDFDATKSWLQRHNDWTNNHDADKKFIYCIGEVAVAVNPFFDPVLI